MYPIVISAPHAQTKIIERSIRKRLKLSDYEIWKCSDPFTANLKEFTCAWYIQKAQTHRLVCDINRPPNDKAFHEYDFFGRKVFHQGMHFTEKEKAELLAKHWFPYHEKLEKKIIELDKKVKKPILFIDYHNTSGDHPLNQRHEYMPGIVISNLGAPETGKKTALHPNISIAANQIQFLKKAINDELGIRIEINEVYSGGYNTIWGSQLKEKLKLRNHLHTIQIEYNLDFIANPLSKKIDRKALKIMQTALNKAIIKLYKNL